MNKAFSTIWTFLKSKFFWINIGLAIIIALIICTVVLLLLNRFTLHGEEIEVPNLEGLYTEEAEMILKKSGLSYEVIDSVYMRDRLQGEIIEQVPAAKSHIKLGRKVYLTINSKANRYLVMPDVRNVSHRQAKAMLEAIGFNVVNIEYRPSEYADLMIDVLCGGEPVHAGQRLCDGAALTLVVGERTSGEMAVVPDLTSSSQAMAEQSIKDAHFVVGAVEFDEEPLNESDKANYFVFKQSPQANSNSPVGHRIDIWLTKQADKAIQKPAEDENFSGEDFF